MNVPAALAYIEDETQQFGFPMASERDTGALLRTLAASKPGGRLLELGTGTGLSTCWLLDGMDEHSRLLSVDNDDAVLAVARTHLGADTRLTITCADGEEYLDSLHGQSFDLIFADTWPGKFFALDNALNLLKVGGLYVIDDLLPQPSWPDGHAPKVPRLVNELKHREALAVVELNWATGIVVATRVSR